MRSGPILLAISTAEDVRRTRALVSWLRRPSICRVDVDLPDLPESERRQVSRKLVALFNDCGCFWGAPTFIGVLALLWVASIPRVSALAAAAVAAVAAKLAGLAWSRWRLDRLLKRLESPYRRLNP